MKYRFLGKPLTLYTNSDGNINGDTPPPPPTSWPQPYTDLDVTNGFTYWSNNGGESALAFRNFSGDMSWYYRAAYNTGVPTAEMYTFQGTEAKTFDIFRITHDAATPLSLTIRDTQDNIIPFRVYGSGDDYQDNLVVESGVVYEMSNNGYLISMLVWDTPPELANFTINKLEFGYVGRWVDITSYVTNIGTYNIGQYDLTFNGQPFIDIPDLHLATDVRAIFYGTGFQNDDRFLNIRAMDGGESMWYTRHPFYSGETVNFYDGMIRGSNVYTHFTLGYLMENTGLIFYNDFLTDVFTIYELYLWVPYVWPV
jgi:hypothetical protein